MANDNYNPFHTPEVKKKTFLTRPVPIWSLGAALLAGSLLSFGFTTLADEETTNTQTQANDASPADPAGPAQVESDASSSEQNNPLDPEPDSQVTAAIGETTTNHGVRLTVDSVEVVRELSMRKEFSSGELETVTPNNEGAKFVRVHTTIANDGVDSLNLACTFRFATALENSQGQRYKAISDIYRIPGNPGCLSPDSVAPGFSGKISYVYEVPDSYEGGYFTYFDPAVHEARENPIRIRLDHTE